MNNNIKRGVVTAATLLGCLVLAVSAQGASFDCGQAGSKGEHVICDSTSLKAAGYQKLGGFLVRNGDVAHPFETSSDVGVEIWCVLDTTKRPVIKKSCVYGVQSVIKRDDKGEAIFKTEDALDFVLSSDFKIFDSDTECASKLHPYRSVVAIGRWKDRKSPQVGGYAYAIKQAWIIDPDSRKFVEISTKDVSCEINEDRD